MSPVEQASATVLAPHLTLTLLIDEMVGSAFLLQLHQGLVTDNGSDACAAVNCLFQLAKHSYLGSTVLMPSNVRCADQSVQHGDISILFAQLKEIIENKPLHGVLGGAGALGICKQGANTSGTPYLLDSTPHQMAQVAVQWPRG
ncbi:hypothetical protein MHU86_18815 [Fragilaria crotonensis]|nr:hypothetical protein MHU86_18815 [Fragilaria crotonensis]